MLGRERGVRRLIRFVRASAEGAVAEDGWSEFHFTGRSVCELRNELYSRIGPHRHPHPDILPFDIVMCVRAGRYGRLPPLITNLPHGCNGETLQIVAYLSETPGESHSPCQEVKQFTEFVLVCLCFKNSLLKVL